MKLRKFAFTLAALLLLALCLAGCETNDAIGIKTDAEELTLIVEAEDFEWLEEYTHLKKLNLNGSTCYDAIEAYIAAHPNVDVTYTVALGDQKLNPNATELTLEADDFTLDELLEKLPHLPQVTKLNLPNIGLTSEEIVTLRETHPDLVLDYSVELFGKLYTGETTELNLPGLYPTDLADVIAALKLLPSVTYVELMDENGQSVLTKENVRALQDALPNVLFHYTFELFGRTVSTADETIEYLDLPLDNSAEAEIRAALDVLQSCTYFKLDDCGIDSTVMAGIRDDYPDVKVVWRIYCGKFSMCTDETMVRMTFKLDDTNCSELKYCTDVTYMDIGHNEKLYDISFVEYMPNLECVIVSGAPVKDISYFANHEKLEFLELVFCGHVKDISCLASCPNLKYLNISYTKVSDLSPIMELPMERLNCMHTNVGSAQRNAFTKEHPDCLSIWTGKQPYGYGWRYVDNGLTYNDYYANMRIVFRYDDKEYTGNYKER